jgi:serralysin
MSRFFILNIIFLAELLTKTSLIYMTSTLANGLIADELYLNPALEQVRLYLKDFANNQQFTANMRLAFGDTFDTEAALSLGNAWKNQDFSIIPAITLLSSAELNGANGAFAATTNTIYLSQEFVANHQENVASITNVILEELGHWIDSQINTTDSVGDEGAIFAALVQREGLSNEDLQLLRAEDDHAVIILDGQSIAIEQQNFTGTSGNDTITGTNQDDVIDGLGGNDRIFGEDGNDTINGGNDGDNLFGGNGNDILNGDAGNDTLNEDTGSDSINGGIGTDTYAANYSDRLVGLTMTFDSTTGNGTIVVGTETDTLTSIENFNYFTGTNFDDTIFGGASGDYNISGGAGNDSISGNAGNDRIFGEDGNDTINGGNDGDNLFGGNGNDILNGDAGDDTLNEDTGNDSINGGAGTDTYAANYSDRLVGLTMTFDSTTGNGTIVVGTETDTLTSIENFNYFTGTNFDDTIFGGASGDYNISGGAGNDSISGNAGNDRIFGEDGNDTINGGNDGDNLFGGNGNDILNGGSGNDNLYGDNDNDTLIGVNSTNATPGKGEVDVLTGGAGSDRFILGDFNWIGYDDGLSNNAGTNDYAQITDFNTSEGDIIQFKGVSTDYLLVVFGADTRIFIDKPGTETDELIGIIKNQTGLSLTANYFAYNQPSISLTVSPSSVLEDGATNIVYTFSRSGSTANALTVNYGITGTADSTDYTGATPGTGKTITFAVGSATATLTIDPTADTTVEANETVALTLATGTGYTIGTTTAVTGTITNDDVTLPSITLAVSPTSVSEDGTTNLIYTFTRTGATTNTLTVNYGITGTANTSDYTGATPGTGKLITFAAGASTATLTIDPTADTIVESNETVALTLATGTGYTIGTTTTVIGTITNDDLLPNLNLSANKTIVEGNTNPQNVTYTVTLSSTSTQTITVQYATANGTAIAGSDYTSTSGTLTFNPGVTSQVINIPILNDSLNEANETFSLTLNSPTNASLGTSQTVTTTISDTLSAAATTTLPTNVENLTLTGTTAINGTGNAGNNVITGNGANNTLSGLNGNDRYSFVANSALGTDTITETATGGTDTIDFTGTTAGVNVNLGVATSQTVNSNLKLIISANNVIENATGGTGNDRLTGNTLNNILSGGDGNDQLQGLGGNDTLWGGAGNDILNGGIGNDSLWGGLGDDILTGGVGNDKYLFQSDSVFSISLGVDYITDFEAGLDQIVLSKTTFNAITNTVGQALTDFAVVTDDEFVNASNARIVFSQGTGSLFYNQDGNVLGTGTVFEFARLGNPDITLSSSNFSLIA